RAAPEILPGTAPHLFGARSPPPDRRRNGRLSHRLSPLSCARLRPRGRIRNAGTRWRAAVKPRLRRSYLCLRPRTLFRYPGLQPFLDQAKYSVIPHTVLDKPQHPFVTQLIEEATNVCIEHPVHSLPLNAHRQRIQRLMRAATRPEPVGKAFEVDLIY